MTQIHDIFVRAHAVPVDQERKRKSSQWDEPKWLEYALVVDTETRITADQSLTFGVFRLCQLRNSKYVLIKEGIFYADDLSLGEQQIIRDYARTEVPDVKSFPPGFPVYSKSEFMT